MPVALPLCGGAIFFLNVVGCKKNLSVLNLKKQKKNRQQNSKGSGPRLRGLVWNGSQVFFTTLRFY